MKIKNNEMRRINVKKTLVLVIILGLVLANFVVIASASPELTEAAKEWLATNAGVGNCFVSSGVSYFTVEGESRTGGTVYVITFLQVAGLLDETKNNVIVNGKSYNDYLAETGETGITDADILWVAAHDEGVEQYCIGATPTPTPTPILSTPSSTQTPSPPPVYTPAPMHTPTLSPISSPSPTPIPTPTPTLVDSDDDGVPGRYDYAPYDPNVQTKSDIKPEITPTPQPPGFEVLFVIVGLLLVAYLIKRRKVK